LKKIQDIIKTNFDYDIKIYPKNKNDDLNIRACVFSKKIREYLLGLGLQYVKCDSKTIPDVIYNESLKNKMSFISGMIDADGCIDNHGIRIVIKSEQFAQNMQMLLLNAGVISSIRKDYPNAYCVHIQGPSLQIIKKHLNLFNKNKKHKLSLLNNTNGKTNNDIIPMKFVYEDFIKAFPSFRGKKGQGFNNPKYSSLQNQINIIKKQRRNANLNYHHLNQMINFLNDHNLEVPTSLTKTLNHNYYYDKIKNIDFLCEEQTYDLEIEDIHSFVCNGFVCHNSQGAEYPAVVLVLHNSQYKMLQRNLFYTGLTRAKKICIVAGTQNAIEVAVENDKEIHRNTTLCELLKNSKKV